METKYILVEWPESQYFIGHEKCYLCEELDCAYFVPENVYNLFKKNQYENSNKSKS